MKEKLIELLTVESLDNNILFNVLKEVSEIEIYEGKLFFFKNKTEIPSNTSLIFDEDSFIYCDEGEEYLRKMNTFVLNKVNKEGRDYHAVQIFEGKCFNPNFFSLLAAHAMPYYQIVYQGVLKDDEFKDDTSILEKRLKVTVMHELGEIFAMNEGHDHFSICEEHPIENNCVFNENKIRKNLRKASSEYIPLIKVKDFLPDYYCERCEEIISRGLEKRLIKPQI